ncbi:MAG: sugar phosphate isomerase/epimerase [Verrucomicrobiota bacterium]
MSVRIRLFPLLFWLLSAIWWPLNAAEIKWTQLSSKKGELPAPGDSTQQTGAVVADFDKNGVNDFVLSFRKVPPALVWYRRTENGWDRYVIEKDFLTVEAGGAVFDIDGDGDLDLVFGGDYQSREVWWWENPYPNYDPNISWKRHIIKKDGKTQHHDQVFGDFKGTGQPQLAFWNQQAKTIFLADIPTDPRNTEPWPVVAIFSGEAGERGDQGKFLYAEGMSAADIDADGKADLLAGNYWFKYRRGNEFTPIKVGTIGGRIKAGQFKPGKYPQIVIAPGDGVGPLKWYECTGNPTNSADWFGHDLAGRDMIHGHTLEVGDIDGDGHLDIFATEMAKWTEQRSDPDNPKAKAWIFYGDGRGTFRQTELVTGNGFHEGRLADLDGDGDLDILNKPYNWDAPRVDVWLNNGTGPRNRRAGVLPAPGQLAAKEPAGQAGRLPYVNGIALRGSFQGPLGLQLYSLRFEMKKNIPTTLALARKMGFEEIEGGTFAGTSPQKSRELLDNADLKCASIGTSYEVLRGDLDNLINMAKTLGAGYVMCAWIPHEKGKFNEQNCRDASAVFNRAGEKLRAAGLRFAYHPHGFEFQPWKAGTLFDLMMAETKPEFVTFELDVFWAAHGGADPVKLLQRYGPRFELMHIKDLRKGAPTGILTGSAPDSDSVAVGAGQVDWPAVLREAQRAGLRHYFIEDEAVEAVDQIPQSVRYLEQVKW